MSDSFLEYQASTKASFRDGQVGVPLGIGDLVIETTVEARVFAFTQLVATAPASALITITGDGATILSTTAATVATWGLWTSITARDVSRGSMVRLVVLTTALAGLSGISGSLEVVQRCCRVLPPTLTSINGITGAVQLSINRFLQPTYVGDAVTLVGATPATRAATLCPSNPCTSKVYTVNGAVPGPYGQLVVSFDDCMKIVPGPTAHQLAWRNDCVPCCNCSELFAVNDQLLTQEAYLHNLSAMHQNQFNRYQARAMIASRKSCLTDIPICSGNIFMVGRSIDRPYFNQVVIGIVNETECSVSVGITCVMDSAQVGNQYDVQRAYTQAGFSTADGVTGSAGRQIVVPWAGFTPRGGETVTFTIEPKRVLTISTEYHRVRVDRTASMSANFHVVAAFTTTQSADPLNPGASLPTSTSTQTRDYPFAVLAATPATVVA